MILRLNRDSLPECETAAENPVASRKLVYQSVSGGRAKPAREKRTSSRIVNHHKRQIRRKAMPAMDTLLFNDPEVKGLAFAILEECTDLQAFGRRMLELLANAAMSAKADEACNAPYGERDEGRVNSRNGYRERGLSTAAGDVTLKIPKLRRGSFFPEDLIERYCRVDRALVAAVAEMYVMGISTRKVEAVAGELGVRSMSKSQVSRLCECLDAEVDAFRRQRFDGVRFAYLWLDATYVKCRVEGRSASQAVVTAIGLDDTGHKRFVGVDCVDTESHAGWKAFLSGLRARGVDGVRLVVSDAHEGLAKAIAETFQGAAWQRCVTHLMRNVAGRIHRKDDQRKAREAMKAVFAQKSPALVRACYQEATEEVLKISRAAGNVLLEAEEAALAYLAFPATHRTKIRTNNVQERANREIKRRTRVVQGFPSRESLIRLVGAALIEADEEWSARCVISRPSLAHAWKAQEREAPGEAEVLAAREAARKIIGSAIDPKEDEG